MPVGSVSRVLALPPILEFRLQLADLEAMAPGEVDKKGMVVFHQHVIPVLLGKDLPHHLFVLLRLLGLAFLHIIRLV